MATAAPSITPARNNRFQIGWTSDDDTARTGCVLVPTERALVKLLQSIYRARDAEAGAATLLEVAKMNHSLVYECVASAYPQPYRSCAYADPALPNEFFSLTVRSWSQASAFLGLHQDKPFVHVVAKSRRRVPTVHPSATASRRALAKTSRPRLTGSPQAGETMMDEADDTDSGDDDTRPEDALCHIVWVSVAYRRVWRPAHARRT